MIHLQQSIGSVNLFPYLSSICYEKTVNNVHTFMKAKAKS